MATAKLLKEHRSIALILFALKRHLKSIAVDCAYKPWNCNRLVAYECSYLVIIIVC